MLHISKNGDGDFSTITEALEFLSADNKEEKTLFIHNGTYKEQITVSIPHVTFIGESRENTKLTYDLYARQILENGTKRGTFRTYSCLIDADYFKASNITFENSSGIGTKAGQALAMYADGNNIIFENCCFLGNQDTLFTGPLPPKEIEPNGFIGPKQFSPRINGYQYYRNCYIEGDIDFIFGSASVYFEKCEFFSKNTGQKINSYVTAASTPDGQKYGYVINDCRFTSNCPKHTCYLGRPWRDYAKTVIINSYIGEHICEEGWHDWGKINSHETVYFAEYGNYGPGSSMDKRPFWVKRLNKEEALSHLLIKNVFI